MNNWKIFGLIPLLALLLKPVSLKAQSSNILESLYTKQTRKVPVSDSVNLVADVYLPIPKRDIKVPANFGQLGIDSVTIFPKGQQYLVYDSVNGEPAKNPRELPFLLQRTPYNRSGQEGLGLLTFLGYGVAIQNNRGRYESEGVYYPFVSNSWETQAYHPDFNHTLDDRSPSDPTSSNKHADGKVTVDYLVKSAKRNIDTNQDRSIDKQIGLTNGSIGMIGASAAGNTQFQAAASIPALPPDSPGLKSLLPIVATAEYHQSTAFHNGVYRRSLVESWIQGTFLNGLNTDQQVVKQDTSRTNALNTIRDYPQESPKKAAEEAVEYLTTRDFPSGKPAYYPNTPMRADLDISRARLNQQGEPDPKGKVSRYNWLEVPTYHLTGWWDIFINGQINTWQQMAKHTNLDKNLLVIGPWTHQKIGQQAVGDVRFPDNVDKFIGNVDFSGQNFARSLNSELLPWLRTTLNENNYKQIGEPTFVIRATPGFQNAGQVEYKAPAEDYRVGYREMLAFLNGEGSLDDFPVDIKTPFGVSRQTFDIPALEVPGFGAFENIGTNEAPFAETPSVRFYMAGPDESEKYGNYWLSADTFPPKGITVQQQDLYWQGENDLGVRQPQQKGKTTYQHKPGEPIETIGGNNLGLQKNGELNQGPKNLEPFKEATMPDGQSLKWQTKPIADSLAIVGTPKMVMHVSTTYADNTFQEAVTNGHFFVRILDVYPNGRKILVTEGAVNAHARRFARKRAENPDLKHQIPFSQDTTAFSNVKVGQQYELTFNLLPIGYTFADSHRLEVVISSSNFPKYQSAPGLPLDPDSFFRWNPITGDLGDHPSDYNSPKVLEQTVYNGEDQQTKLTLPVWGKQLIKQTNNQGISKLNESSVKVYPNPVAKQLNGKLPDKKEYRVQLHSLRGKILQERLVSGRFQLNLSRLPAGLYFLKVYKENALLDSQKVIKH